MARILAAEDDPFGRRYLEATLQDAGYGVVAVGDGLAAWEAYRAAQPAFDLVITDVRMPGLSGIDLIGLIRADDPHVGIIAVSALGSDREVVAGLEVGADDYLVKPLSAAVLLAKVRTVLRRSEPGLPNPGDVLEVGDLRLEVGGQRLTRAGKVVPLTRTELAVVEYLMRNAGRIVSPTQILAAVWGEAYEHDLDLLRAAVLRARRKLGTDARGEQVIRTHVGLGYSVGYEA